VPWFCLPVSLRSSRCATAHFWFNLFSSPAANYRPTSGCLKLVDEITEAAKQLLGITVKREKAMLRKAKGEKKASK